jgi:hypothetical protein
VFLPAKRFLLENKIFDLANEGYVPTFTARHPLGQMLFRFFAGTLFSHVNFKWSHHSSITHDRNIDDSGQWQLIQ